jgi:broad specificity phosphatase PhoE
MDLYLARHGEATADEDGLSTLGQRQAIALGQRLRSASLMRIYHGPLPRAAQTAAIVARQLEGVEAEEDEAAGDYVPYAVTPDETPPAFAAFVAAMGPASPDLAAEAESRFAGTGDAAALVVTHNFLIAWLVRAALGAPPARWLGMNFCNAALTLIRYLPGRPPSILLYNDQSHLPDELRWTGFPPALRP